MMGFSQQQVADTCRAFGSQVAPLPQGIDGAQLLWAISGNESSFGANTTPRHEPAFDVGGAYSTHGVIPHLLSLYGSAAACSYGCWQILLANAADYAPSDFDDITKGAQATVTYLNSRLRAWKPQTLAAIGEIWNAGSPMQNPSAGVAAYVTELARNYQVSMPDSGE